MQHRHRGVEFAYLSHGRGLAEAARARDARKIDTRAGVGRLHPGFAVMLVVDDRDCEGFFAAAVASAPNPISISPSPVTTKTRRFGCARASPNPTVTALPIAPQR